jgi:Uma2 family endonuclease
MSAPGTRLTVEDFARMPAPADDLAAQELIDGEIVTTPVPKLVHDWVKNLLKEVLDRYLAAPANGKCLVAVACQLGRHSVLKPDVSVYLRSVLPLPRGTWLGAPEIAMEVVSSDQAADIKRKIRLYLEHGARRVWIVYPAYRSVTIYSGTQVRELCGANTIEEPDLLPGFQLSLASLFEGLP